MGDASAIEWTDATWNFIRAIHRVSKRLGWICVRISEGCRNCYARTMNAWRGNGADYSMPGLGEVEMVLDGDALAAPLRWKQPRKVFVCSMTDLFGEWVPDEWIDRAFAVMAQTPRHTYQVLTKRAARMRAYSVGMSALSPRDRSLRIARSMYREHPAERLVIGGLEAPSAHIGDFPWPLPNVVAMTSVENQPTADERIPQLLQTPAAVRGLSVEPLLGPVTVTPWLTPAAMPGHCITIDGDWWHKPGACKETHDCCRPRVDWIIVGGESGPGARPCDLAWIRSIVAQTKAASVPVFVKQLGARPFTAEAADMAGKYAPMTVRREKVADSDGYRPVVEIDGWEIPLRDRKGGAIEEWPEDLRVREFPRP